MNERQAFALARPLSDPIADRPLIARLTAVRKHGTGLQIMTILAVDR